MYHLVSIKYRLKMKIQFIILCVPFLPHITEQIAQILLHFFKTTKIWDRDKIVQKKTVIFKISFTRFTSNFGYTLWTSDLYSIKDSLIFITIWLHTQNKMLVAWLRSHIWNIQSSSPPDLIFIGECPNLASQLSVML